MVYPCRWSRRCAGAQRPAFTLIELLVVVSIIAVLLTLTAAAVMRYVYVQEEANTKVTLQKIQGRLNEKWVAVTEEAKKEPIPSGFPNWGQSTERNRVIYIKARQKQALPMTFDEALNPTPLPPLPGFQRRLNTLGISGSSGATTPFESAALLLMALERGTSGVMVDAEDLGVSVGEFKLSNGKTIKALVDEWNQPLVFSRWPTGLVLLHPPQGLPRTNDPSDPFGQLTYAGWLGTGGYNNFVTHLHALPPRLNDSPYSYKLKPMVVSSGLDEELGMDRKTLAKTGPTADDNLYSNLDDGD